MRKYLSIWKNLSDAAKSSVVFLVATILTKGIIFLTTPIFTRLMDEADIGLVGTYTSWRSMFEIFSILSITSAGVFNVGMSQFRKNRDQYLSSLIGFCVCSTVIVSSMLLFSLRWTSDFIDMPRHLIYLMCVQSMILPAESFWVSKQRYEYKYKAAFWVVVLTSLVSQAVAVIAVYFAHNNLAEVRLWAAACVELPVGFFFIILLVYKGRCIVNKTIWKEMVCFAIPLIPHYLASMALTSSDRIMIYNLDSPDAAGIYTVAYGVGGIGSIIWGAIQGSFTPYVFDGLDNNDTEGVAEVANKLIAIFGTGCVFISLIAPEVLSILGPKTYQDGIYVLPPIIGAIFVSCLYNLFSSVEFYYKKSGFIAFASVIAAGSNVLLNLIFIPLYGYIAAGYTTLIAYIILSLMHYINMKRVQIACIYNEKQVFCITGGLLTLCLACQILYKLVLIRYFICAVLICIAVIKREFIREVLGKK